MKTKVKRTLLLSMLFLLAFVIWSVLIQTVDVRPVGVNSTDIGFAFVNTRFHSLTGVDFMLYNITDWLGLVPLAVCIAFGILGFIQLIKRKSLFKVDADIIILGVYYVTVILCYLVFEMIPINYRPVLINGFAEASYPSSTTLLVLSVMPTLVFQIKHRMKNIKLQRIVTVITLFFCIFMVVGRLISGVHWLTDIIGSVLLSAGLFYAYKSACLLRRFNYGV